MKQNPCDGCGRYHGAVNALIDCLAEHLAKVRVGKVAAERLCEEQAAKLQAVRRAVS